LSATIQTTSESSKYPSLSVTYIAIFCIGAACMAVAGYFLIEGLSEFSGNETTTRMLIIGGVLFQLTESICFISASALTYHSMRWRYILFTLGVVLFAFSIGVMTLAQKTALQTGEAQAQANDEKRKYLRKQITSIDSTINSYRQNAVKQSKSIYKDSRALGQDSLNRAAEMEQRKSKLSQELFSLTNARRQTSSDFFRRIEEVFGLPATTTEFYFLVIRSLLLELSAIILMSFGANLRAYNKMVNKHQEQTNTSSRELTVKKPYIGKLTEPTIELDTPAGKTYKKTKKTNALVETITQTPGQKVWDSNEFVDYEPERPSASSTELNHLVTLLADLHEQQLLPSLDPDSIAKSLKNYCNQKINMETASVLSKLINNRLDEPC